MVLGVAQDAIASDPNYVNPGLVGKNVASSGVKTIINLVSTLVILNRYSNPPTVLATGINYVVSVLTGITLDSVQAKPARYPPPKPAISPPLGR